MNPVRIQRSRQHRQVNPNGLQTIYVGRPTKWGNPFRLTPDGWIMYYSSGRHILNPWVLYSATGGFTNQDIVELYEQWIKGKLKLRTLPEPPDPSELKGKNLSCWCNLNEPCHADVLLEFANKK